MQVEFILKNARTQMGQIVHVIGSNKSIGLWSTTMAPAMTTNGDNYPQWQNASPIEMTEFQILEYKYIIKDGRNKVIWEDGQNRKANLLSYQGKIFQAKQDQQILVIEDQKFDKTVLQN